jgi:hypothetical protein
MTRQVLYLAHPVAPTDEEVQAVIAELAGVRGRRVIPERADDPETLAWARAEATRANVQRAMRWLSWLRRSFREVTFIAPWIAAILAGEDDADPVQREAGMVDCETVVPRCDGVVLCGGRIGTGGARERGRARRAWDLTGLGPEPEAITGTPAKPFEEWFGEEESSRAHPGVPETAAAGAADRPGDGLQAEHSARQDVAAAAEQAGAVEHPKPCARRLGSTWCTRTDAHEPSDCSGAPEREIAAHDFGPTAAVRRRA